MDANFRFYNEKDEILDHKWIEQIEQSVVDQIINENCVVLELGARYGMVSCKINRKLKDPTKQVSVEPDPLVWNALEKNRDINKCNFYILKGAVSRVPLTFFNHDLPYASFTTKADTEDVNRLTLDDLEKLCNLKFNTLVADCEGFLGQFFEENPHMYEQLQLIFFEKDGIHICNYDIIIDNLIKYKFTCILQGDHQVWVKQHIKT